MKDKIIKQCSNCKKVLKNSLWAFVKKVDPSTPNTICPACTPAEVIKQLSKSLQ